MSALTPAEILARAREVYATCRTYQDTGVVVSRTLHPDTRGRSTSRRPFATAFVRPDRFRFEWAEADVTPEEEWTRTLILCNEGGVRASWSLEAGLRTHATVHEPIGAAAGVSGGSSYTVPVLLMPGGAGRDPLPAPESVSLRGREWIGGHECYGLEHAHREGGKQVLWLGCDDFLLRRIDQEQVFDERVFAQLRQSIEEHAKSASSDEQRKARASMSEHFERTQMRPFRTETVTSYEPALDLPIAPERFAAPPAWTPAGEASATPTSGSRAPRVFAPCAPELGVPEILAQVRRVYARCGSYRDSGTTTTVSEPHGALTRRHTSLQTHALAFVRPDRLRFETAHPTLGPEDEWMRMISLWNADGVHWWHVPGGKRSASKVEDLARFGQSHTPVGLLLARGEHLDPLPTDETASLLGSDTLDGRECFVVKGMLPGRGERTLWISRADFLVRRSHFVSVFDERWYREQRQRLEEQLKQGPPEAERASLEQALEHFSKPMEPYRSETTITFAPELEPTLAPSIFATPAD